MVSRSLIDVVAPLRCFSCGAAGLNPCVTCIDALGSPPVVSAPGGLDGVVALCRYHGVGRDLLTAIKYQNDRPATRWAGERLGRAVAEYEAERECARRVEPIGWVTWVPARRSRRRRHGVDPGRVLAAEVARAIDAPLVRAFRRGPGPGQTELGRSDRLVGPDLRLVGPARGRGGRCLVVDDVMTTGATLRVAGAALRHGSVSGVTAAVVAVTPPPGEVPGR